MGSNPEYVALVRRCYPEMLELFAAGEEVKSLVTHPGWAYITRLLDFATADVDAMLDGRLHEHAEYARLHGRRNGLKAMRDAADAIVAESTRRLEEQRNKHEATAETVA